MSSSNYASAPAEMLAKIIRQAEAPLAAQLTVGLAADQRALTFAGLIFAAAAALLGAALGASPDATLTLPAVATALGLVISAVLAVVSARPVEWDLTGNLPSSWLCDITENTDPHDALAAIADHYDEMIKDNDKAIRAAAFWLRLSMVSALASLVLGSALVLTRMA